MIATAPVVCPKCNGSDVTLVHDGQRYRDLNDSSWKGIKVVNVYRCNCGVAFTKMDDPTPRGPAPS
jgi:hypothetical protein